MKARWYPFASSWLCLLLASPSLGAEQDVDRFSISADGQEVLDTSSKSIWRRCVEGMHWNSKTCVGTPLAFDHAQAMARAKDQAASSQLSWRIPSAAQLRRLGEASRQHPAVHGINFPAAPAGWHWSASVSTNNAQINPYNYGNVMQGLGPTSVNRLAFLQGWAVNWGSGEARGDVLKRELLAVRLVRPG
ncbi:MAG TPA: DUF1566 domain-containing protein [Burkholderiaceae bacterium]|nr:DUF1566 domain-containing protein [Burkholderiaceae bacterium]